MLIFFVLLNKFCFESFVCFDYLFYRAWIPGDNVRKFSNDLADAVQRRYPKNMKLRKSIKQTMFMIEEIKKILQHIQNIKKNPGMIVLKRLAQTEIDRWSREKKCHQICQVMTMSLRNRKKM